MCVVRFFVVAVLSECSFVCVHTHTLSHIWLACVADTQITQIIAGNGIQIENMPALSTLAGLRNVRAPLSGLYLNTLSSISTLFGLQNVSALTQMCSISDMTGLLNLDDLPPCVCRSARS